MTESPERAIAALGLVLPTVPAPVAAYVPALRVGDLIITSGQLPTRNGVLIAAGRVGSEVDLETAQICAQQCALNALAAIRDQVGELSAVKRLVRLTAYIASQTDFTAQSLVANGASTLLQDVFGAAGAHVRSAVGVAALPLGAPVELEIVVQVQSTACDADAQGGVDLH